MKRGFLEHPEIAGKGGGPSKRADNALIGFGQSSWGQGVLRRDFRTFYPGFVKRITLGRTLRAGRLRVGRAAGERAVRTTRAIPSA